MNSRNIIKRLILVLCIVVITATCTFAVESTAPAAVPPKTKVVTPLNIPEPAPITAPATTFATEIKKTPNLNQKQYIKDIEITGANAIRPEYITNKMMLHSGEEYSRDILQIDLKSIYQMGFFTERLKAVPIQNPDNTITLKIIVEENIPITDFTIEGNSVVSTEEILSYLLPLRGKPQNVATINEAIEKIQECYSEKGYILARVSSFSDDPDGMINLVMSEGTINKILISGNEKTKDFVIERNILTEPGMIYNENQLKSDLVRLYATQAFKDVDRVIEQSTDNPDKYDVTINVKEQRTATVSLGGGLDSATGIFGSFGISDNNFRGLNQRVGLNVLAGSGVILNDSSIKNHMNLQAELSFYEPYFYNADTSLMGKVFFRDFGSYQIPLAIEQRFGAEATLAHRVKSNKNLTSTFALGIENIKVKEGDGSEIARLYSKYNIPISERAKQLEGGLFLSMAPGLIYDTRDSATNPRNGVIASAKFEEEIGINKLNNTHGKLNGSIKKYIPIMKKSSLSLTARGGGKIHGNMPEVMAYRLGGPYTVRGFKMSGVGTGDAYVMGSIELATPLLGLDRIKKLPFLDNVKLTMFVDAGRIFNPTMTDVMYDRPMQAVTAGVGLKVYIPGMGPLSVDYGMPLTNPGYSGSKHGYFTFGVGDMMY